MVLQLKLLNSFISQTALQSFQPGTVIMICPILAGEGVLHGTRGEHRRIEDKLLSMGLELKNIQVCFDVASLHGNRTLWFASSKLLFILVFVNFGNQMDCKHSASQAVPMRFAWVDGGEGFHVGCPTGHPVQGTTQQWSRCQGPEPLCQEWLLESAGVQGNRATAHKPLVCITCFVWPEGLFLVSSLCVCQVNTKRQSQEHFCLTNKADRWPTLSWS